MTQQLEVLGAGVVAPPYTLFTDALLDRETLAVLAAYAVARRYDAGSRLCPDEARIGVLYVVGEGRCRLVRLSSSGREATLAVLQPGGLCDLARERAHTYLEVQARSALLYLVDERILPPLAQAYPPAAAALIGLLRRQLADAYDRIEDLALHGVKGRLARLLARLALADPRHLVRETQADLAAQIGTSREEVAKALAQLRAAGHIAYRSRQRQILVHDPRSLLIGDSAG